MCPARRTSARFLKKKASATSEDAVRYGGKTLAELRKLREQEIAALNFEEVRIIDSAIANLGTDNTQAVLDECRADISQFIDDGYAYYESSLEEKQRELEGSELKLRRSINEQFQAAKARHIDEISNHETARSLSIIRSQQRSSAKYNLMRQQAVNIARGPAVDEAIKIRSAAADALAEELQQRGRAINNAYDRGLQYLLKCQADELTVIEEHLAKGIERLDNHYQQFEIQRQQVLMVSISERLRKVMLHAQPKLSRKEAFDDVVAALKDFVRDKIVTEDRVFIFQPAELK
jgi:hypothetical protein